MKLLPAVACAAVLALTTTASSAAVVGNDDGDCWRVQESFALLTMTGSGRTARSIAGATPVPATAISAAVSGSASKNGAVGAAAV